MKQNKQKIQPFLDQGHSSSQQSLSLFPSRYKDLSTFPCPQWWRWLHRGSQFALDCPRASLLPFQHLLLFPLLFPFICDQIFYKTQVCLYHFPSYVPPITPHHFQEKIQTPSCEVCELTCLAQSLKPPLASPPL